MIRQSVAALGVESLARIVTANVFIWQKRRPELGPGAWVVFCSPPWDFYVQRSDEMLELIGSLVDLAPPESLFVVEADERFDFGLLPESGHWDIRSYPPAVVGVYGPTEE